MTMLELLFDTVFVVGLGVIAFAGWMMVRNEQTANLRQNMIDYVFSGTDWSERYDWLHEEGGYDGMFVRSLFGRLQPPASYREDFYRWMKEKNR